jgi:hypothetical protein
MIILQAMDDPTLPRLVANSLRDRLRIMPAVVVTGARAVSPYRNGFSTVSVSNT